MPTAQTFDLAGHTWTVHPIDFDDQFEVEVILLRTLAPAAGYGLAALVEEAAPPLVEVLRDTAGQGPNFDLRRLLTLDTKDPRIQASWERLLAGLGAAAGGMVKGIAAAMTRVQHQDLRRLGELAFFGRKMFVRVEGRDMLVTGWEDLSRLLQREPAAKWRLLVTALQVTYDPGAVARLSASEASA